MMRSSGGDALSRESGEGRGTVAYGTWEESRWRVRRREASKGEEAEDEQREDVRVPVWMGGTSQKRIRM